MSFQAYLDNIKAKTGKTAEDFKKLAEKKGLLKPEVRATEIVNWLKKEYDLGHGHAMAIYATFKGFFGKESKNSKPAVKKTAVTKSKKSGVSNISDSNSIDIKLAAPAQRALAGARIKSLKDLSQLTEKEFSNLHGIGPNAIKQLKQALKEKNLKFKP